MRSRDGNHAFSLTIYALVTLFLPTLLLADEYLVSYRYFVRDALLINESLEVSRSMRSCSGKPAEYIIFENSQDENLHSVLKKNNEAFIEFIHKLGISVEHREKSLNSTHTSSTTLTLKTTCFKVDFNDTFVTISALK